MIYNNGSATLILIVFPFLLVFYWVLARTGKHAAANYARNRLDSFSISNVYAWVYATQLNNTFLIAINFEHIMEIGLQNALSEDSTIKNTSNVITIVLIVWFPVQ